MTDLATTLKFKFKFLIVIIIPTAHIQLLQAPLETSRDLGRTATIFFQVSKCGTDSGPTRNLEGTTLLSGNLRRLVNIWGINVMIAKSKSVTYDSHPCQAAARGGGLYQQHSDDTLPQVSFPSSLQLAIKSTYQERWSKEVVLSTSNARSTKLVGRVVVGRQKVSVGILTWLPSASQAKTAPSP